MTTNVMFSVIIFGQSFDVLDILYHLEQTKKIHMIVIKSFAIKVYYEVLSLYTIVYTNVKTYTIVYRQ